uniref:ANK_REP_REGION domain-containing protein n=1 Tax=Steinernema glaseri TaxID=37863 RepID=A0A1I7Z815_9BILA
MGNSSSTVTAGIKNQADGRSNVIYQLADVTGNGELAELAKMALKTGNFIQLDLKIMEKIRPLLYNDGEGAMIPMAEVIAMRHKERTGNEYECSGKKSAQKYICWRLDCRGAVGETLLHVCFLSGLPEHMKLLAQRLIVTFPAIINDFYLCDEYYENAEMVRFLLKKGASVSQRCCGNFFTCDDQKAMRTDSVDCEEHVVLPAKTDYSGHLYWGEYPLSFAACLSQADCFRMLVAYGANPNNQDTNGNSVLHICTIRENWDMFSMALEAGADLHIQNRMGLTPLTLAAFLAKSAMFEKIMKKERKILWTYGRVLMAAFPLAFIDSIDPATGELNRLSALALAVYGKQDNHLALLPNTLEHIVMRKWTVFGKKIHLVCVFSSSELKMSTKTKVYTALSMLAVIGACSYLIQMFLHIHNVGRKMYLLSLSGFPGKAIFLVSCALVLLAFLLRLSCLDEPEDIVWMVVVLLTAAKCLFFCRAFSNVGPSVLMVYKIIVRDLLRFFVIYCIIVVGFSQSFYIIFLGYRRGDETFDIEKEGTIMSNFAESFVRMFMMSLTEFGVFYEQLEQCELATIGKSRNAITVSEDVLNPFGGQNSQGLSHSAKNKNTGKRLQRDERAHTPRTMFVQGKTAIFLIAPCNAFKKRIMNRWFGMN